MDDKGDFDEQLAKAASDAIKHRGMPHRLRGGDPNRTTEFLLWIVALLVIVLVGLFIWGCYWLHDHPEFFEIHGNPMRVPIKPAAQ